MKSLRLLMLMGASATASVAIFAAPIESVNLDGSAGHSSLHTAIAAVDNGGVVQFVEAGTYTTGSLVLLAGKSYTIRNNSGGTVVYEVNAGSVQAPNKDEVSPIYTPGNVNVTLEGFTIQRTAGTGPTIDIDQRRDGETVSLTLNNMVIDHTVGPTGGGEAVKFDNGAVTGALPIGAVTFTANGSTFRSRSTTKAGIRVQSDLATFQNTTISLTDCTVTSDEDAGVMVTMVAGQPMNSLNLNFTNVTINALKDRGLEFSPNATGEFNNKNVTLTGVTINTEEEGILCNVIGAGNDWVIDRSRLNNTFGTPVGDKTIDLRYDDAPTTNTNTVKLYNSIIRSQQGVTSATRAVHLQDSMAEVYHNTFIAAGTGGARVLSTSNSAGTLGSIMVCVNNAILNYKGEDIGGGIYDIAGGSMLGSQNNVIVGPTDDDSFAGSRVYISAGENQASAIVSAGVSGSSLAPLLGSPLLEAGATNATVLSALGNQDINGDPRPFPALTDPDAGAIEIGTPNPPTDAKGWDLYQ